MSTPKGIEKYALGLAGKFAVASELCKRDVVARPTPEKGNRNELFVESKNGKLRIRVCAIFS